MKRLIRHKDTSFFFKSGEWVPEARQADEYSSVDEAAQVKAQHGLTDHAVELYYMCGEQPSQVYDFAIPFGNQQERPSA